MTKNYDVIVIGGGPGGSTVASFIAMQKNKVLLLERESFPRHQIGESLLPATVHGICTLLQIRDKVLNAGFVVKPGASFIWGRNPEMWGFKFRRTSAVPEQLGYSLQVERSKFDALLLESAREKGVEVRTKCSVQDVLQNDDGVVYGVRFIDETGSECSASARFVIDASGNTSRTHKLAGERVYSRFFQNIAIYAYFLNGKRLPSPMEGNTLSAAFDLGWFWYIPLSEQLTSVGAVVAKEHAQDALRNRGSALRGFIDRCPSVRGMLEGATRVTEGIYGEVRIRKDYSYANERFWKPGFCVIGDAACFIDPIFSSGVHLATYGALLAARSINSVLNGDFSEPNVMEEFERRYRKEYGHFYTFNLAFYDANHTEEEYYWKARSILGTEEQNNNAFVRLVSGLAPEEFFGARKGLGNVLMKHVLEPDSDPRDALGFDKSKFDLFAFTDEMAAEGYQIEGQAGLRPRRPEKPKFGGVLVPSEDGLHWSRYVESEDKIAMSEARSV